MATWVKTGGGGWTLIGNPDPSAIDWTLVIRESGIDNALYYYDAELENYRDFIQYQPQCSVGNDSRYIPAMQGFMVHANNSGLKTLSMDCTCRVHKVMDTYYKHRSTVKNIMTVKVVSAVYSDETFIVLDDNANPDFDGSKTNINDKPQRRRGAKNLIPVIEYTVKARKDLKCHQVTKTRSLTKQ